MLGHFFSEHMDERYILKSVVGQPAEGLCVLKRFPDSIILAKHARLQSFNSQGHSRATHTQHMVSWRRRVARSTQGQ
ncbi:hypothetical protein CH063_00786 [Colletotrichum higginsianum]|uniref:Uncharacterized protein n=1 Tax=Colletotrichum higginsianum (strain IMI 349063) TaxID=759273 RepID=H1UWH8_COLHI|nr:hypothetical protein CH063_00786 [Colletotrichum higginsianum]